MKEVRGEYIAAADVEYNCPFCGDRHEAQLDYRPGGWTFQHFSGPRVAPCNGQQFRLIVETYNGQFV